MSDTYEDIINMPYEKSVKHPHMSRHDRAAQFAPFAALTGFDGAIDETARLTDGYIDLGTDKIAELDDILNKIRSHIKEMPEALITYFVEDEYKAGGKFVKTKGRILKIDENRREITVDSTVIPMDALTDIEL